MAAGDFFARHAARRAAAGEVSRFNASITLNHWLPRVAVNFVLALGVVMRSRMYLGKRSVGVLVVAGSTFPFAAMSTEVVAEVYPKRPITLVVGYPAGGTADFIARHLSKHMTEELGQKVVIENRAGAAGNVAAASVAKADPDGYTVYMAARPSALHKTMYKGVNYDFSKDFVPIAMVTSVPYVLLAAKHISETTLQGAISLSRAKPDGYTCASGDIGSTPHLIYEALRERTGLQCLYVPYKGDVPVLTEMIAGRADFAIVTAPAVLPQLESNNLHALAVFSDSRLPALPSVPSVAELGYPDAGALGWFAIMAPTGTPTHAIARLNRAINRALSSQSVREKLTQLGYTFPSSDNTPEALEVFLEEDTHRWTTILESRQSVGIH
ncbi:tripartite tricarboxylate transporter substrate binding protein [Bordetella sp. LUAb4]|uniref:Bug family tripartite tricarboxylate transporter substrate binding protein n=1 Tax=Bordetella sp. LUAb4 TaxID=2843195 RepID=UPI001E6119FF|nr:tripartite tricarboxylate transporter substrate binding protein [Bordetella sp. LUAb4]